MNTLRCEINQCEVPSGTVLTKYYKPTCPYSLAIEGIVDALDSAIERNGLDITVRYVDCTVCECKNDNIELVPTLAVHKDKTEIARFKGSAGMDDYVRFILQHLNVKESLLRRSIKNINGKIIKLKEIDFDEGFVGPWIILYYYDRDNDYYKLFKEVAEEYKTKIFFGIMDGKRSERIRKKHNIYNGPSIMGIFKGVLVTYNGEKKIADLKQFCDKLIEPSFNKIDMETFNKIESKDPIFIVFYSDLSLANYYFKRIAHEFKFKSKFYKTNDQILFDRAGIYPRKSVEEESLSDEEKVILTVYKDGVFHKSPHPLSDGKKVTEWIFFSHFPHVTRITSDNFTSIFHGMKPATILLTRDELYVDQLEKFSSNHHFGLPYTDFVFSTLDMNSYPFFMKTLLPEIDEPIVMIYNPITHQFFYDPLKLTKATFESTLVKLLEDYANNRLKPYPQAKSRIYVYLAVALLSISAIYVLKKYILERLYKSNKKNYE